MVSKRGPHPHNALSDRAIRARKPSEKTTRIADGNGLYLVIRGASKVFSVRTVVHGIRRDISLGSAALLSLSDAREQAREVRRVARAGGDPVAERRARRRVVPTLATAVKDAHAARSREFRNPKHAAQWLSSMGCLLDALGDRPVDAVTSGDLFKVLDPLWVRTPETAKRVLQRTVFVFDRCKAQGFVTGDNPAATLGDLFPKKRGPKRHHAALPFASVPSFIEELRATPSAGPLVKLAFEFLILTAARTGEVIGARWEEIDAAAATWTVPAARMKAHAEHRVPLPPRVVELLEEAKRLGDSSGYLFPGRKRGAPLSNMCFLMALKRMGRDDITPHGFRSSFRDWAEETGVRRSVSEAALAHTVADKVEAAYRRTDLFEERRSVMSRWAMFATTGHDGAAPAQGA